MPGAGWRRKKGAPQRKTSPHRQRVALDATSGSPADTAGPLSAAQSSASCCHLSWAVSAWLDHQVLVMCHIGLRRSVKRCAFGAFSPHLGTALGPHSDGAAVLTTARIAGAAAGAAPGSPFRRYELKPARGELVFAFAMRRAQLAVVSSNPRPAVARAQCNSDGPRAPDCLGPGPP